MVPRARRWCNRLRPEGHRRVRLGGTPGRPGLGRRQNEYVRLTPTLRGFW